MKVEINLPKYLTIGHYKQLQKLEHLTDLEKLVETIHILSGIAREEISKWSTSDIQKISVDLVEKMDFDSSEYYPIIEWKGELYGYAALSKLKMGEYLDLDRLTKDPDTNLEQIAALLYRPITKQHFDSLSFKVKNGIKLANNKAENIFNWYELEEYDSEARDRNAVKMKDFPVSYILGGLSFFLGIASKSLNNMNPSSETTEEEIQTALESISDGLQQFILYQKVPSLA